MYWVRMNELWGLTPCWIQDLALRTTSQFIKVKSFARYFRMGCL